MNDKYLQYLACPKCQGELKIHSIQDREGENIKSGKLACRSCNSFYDIVRQIPRFVPIENYASGFGFEWVKHAKTQYDGYSGINESEKRFFEETKWDRNLEGQVILEVGSGSGRFTEHAASTGAIVLSMDYSYAVEANYSSNGNKDNVFIVQGDIYSMPFKKRIADKLFCFGVLQHTPDVRKAFKSLPPYLKPMGELVVDIYKKSFYDYFGLKYKIRRFTRNVEQEKLYNFVKKYVDFMWPVCSIIRKIPKIGPIINWSLLIPDYSRRGLKGDILKEWAYLDAFDMLAPRYDSPQTLKTVLEWFMEAGLIDIDVKYGYNGIEGRGRRPENERKAL